MEDGNVLTAKAIREVFNEEVRELGGRVCDSLEYSGRFCARSILPRNLAVSPGDLIQGGFAVRFFSSELNVRPYVFRRVCSNGAILARSLEAWDVPEVESREPDQVLGELRAAIRACAADEVFENAAGMFRLAQRTPLTAVDLNRVAAELARRVGGVLGARLARLVTARIASEREHSSFTVGNAVTSVARETPDPEARWRLEVLGAEIMAPSAVGARLRSRAAASREPSTRLVHS